MVTLPWPAFQKLNASRAQHLVAHLLRLEPHDRRMRFCGVVSDAAIRTYCRDVDRPGDLMVGFIADGAHRGIGELRPFKGHDGLWAYDLALSVERAYQDRQVGTELMRRLLILAKNRNAKLVRMHCLPENAKMQRIARKFRAALCFEDGSVEAHLKPSFPSWASFCEEAIHDSRALSRAWFPASVQAA
ncbi:MAG: GNAT family N-acetyltransferase [Geminicoccaceae bacterium]